MAERLAELTREAMTLAPADRARLACELWDSLDGVSEVVAEEDQAEAVQVALRRDEELSSGTLAGRSHEEVMQAARDALRCE